MTNQPTDYLQISRYIAEIDSFAKSKGINLSIRTDFEHLWDLCKGLPGKSVPAVLFDPNTVELSAENAFWVEGTNGGGEVVHLQAVRCDDLTGTTLAEMIDSLSEHFMASGPIENDKKKKFCYAPSAAEITGKVCYHGEIWLRGGPNGYRGQDLSSILPRLILGLALAKWTPDFIYGLGHSWMVERGMHQKYGYRRAEARGAYMEQSKFSRPVDSWLTWMTQSDLIDLTHFEPHQSLAAGMGY